jgi:hypothetical protein
MKRAALILVLVLGTAQPAWADLEAGLEVLNSDPVFAFEEFRALAKQGDPVGMYWLGNSYLLGRGVREDRVLAESWYRKAAKPLRDAAEKGDANAQYCLGLLYSGGRGGLPKGYSEAAKWYRRAANQGHKSAMLFLGLSYRNGQGVPTDYVLAYKWFSLAAARDRSMAEAGFTSSVAKKMTAQQIAEAQRITRVWRPRKEYPNGSGSEPTGSLPDVAGSGFVISTQGHVLTNNHVIDGCATLRVNGEHASATPKVVAKDPRNDLALLMITSPRRHVARFRQGRAVRPGEDVVVVGFPLRGLLAPQANVTTGTVSALAGPNNDTRLLQITAPVQPGNSGGPLLDQGGNVIGIVASKLDALRVAEVTGDIPQNVNFAVKASVARIFLESQGVAYETADTRKKLEPADIAERARKYTVVVECWK